MWIKMISFARKSTDLFKKNYLKEEGSGFWEKMETVYVAKSKDFFQEQTHLFM